MISSNFVKIDNSVIIHTKLFEDFDNHLIIKRLSKVELDEFHELNSIQRKREFITTRILLKDHFDDHCILTYRNKKPILNEGTYISISHKNDELVICLNESYQIGVDIEKIDSRIQKITSKFCGPSEVLEFENNKSIELLTMFWSAKEAIYKCLNNENNIYLKDISVTILNNEKGFGEINGERYLLDFKKYNECYIICHAQKKY